MPISLVPVDHDPFYSNFRRSDNIDDRRDDSFLKNWGGAISSAMMNEFRNGPSLDDIKSMIQHPMTRWIDPQYTNFQSPTPLAVEAGVNDIGVTHLIPIDHDPFTEEVNAAAN